MLLSHSLAKHCAMTRGKAWHTATSRTSFWPLLMVSRALRMGGSFSVSNLTVGAGQLCVERATAGRSCYCCARAGESGGCLHAPSTTAPVVRIARLAKRNTIFPVGPGRAVGVGGRQAGEARPGGRLSSQDRSWLTDDLVDLAVTNTGGASEPAEGRGPEGGRADGATSRGRERGTGPGEGGNAAARGETRQKALRQPQFAPIGAPPGAGLCNSAGGRQLTS